MDDDDDDDNDDDDWSVSREFKGMISYVCGEIKCSWVGHRLSSRYTPLRKSGFH